MPNKTGAEAASAVGTPLSDYARKVAGLVNGSSGSTSYEYPSGGRDTVPTVDLGGPEYGIHTDCSGWVHYALNSVAPLHDAVLQAQRDNPVFQGSVSPSDAPAFTLDGRDQPWTQADALQYFFSGGTGPFQADGANGFSTVSDISTVMAGDLIAYSTGIYSDPHNPNSATDPGLGRSLDTGHSMIAVGKATVVGGTAAAGHGLADPSYTVWSIPVVDSSILLHFDDNRRTAASGATGPLPSEHGKGTGSGEVWFAVDAGGTIRQVRFSSGDDYFPNDTTNHHAIKVGISRLEQVIDLSHVPLDGDGDLVMSVLPSAEPTLMGTTYRVGETLTGAGGLHLTGGGTLTMTGANSYTGGTRLSGAGTTLAIASGDALGTGPLRLQDGTGLVFTAGLTLVQAITLSGQAALAVGDGVAATVGGAISGGSLLVGGGGRLTLSASSTYAGGTVLVGGQLSLLQSDAAGTGPISFTAGVASMLSLGAGVQPGVALTGFGAGDSLDLVGFDEASSTASYSDGSLSVADAAGHSVRLAVSTNPADRFVHLARDALGSGVLVTLDDSPCFCPGTLILTPQGEVPVERLAIGDRVMACAAPGGAVRPEPIRWIGRRSFAGRFVSGRRNLLPVCIRAGALADGVPRRDLVVSPLHAMLFEGWLVPAGLLVNGRSIVQAERVDRLDYLHIELPGHAILWAEGAATESFLDDGSRGMFHNAPEYAALYGPAPAKPGRFCAPRLESGIGLDLLRRRLAWRAGLPADGGAQLRGRVQGVSGRRVWGWAVDEARPDAPLRLDVVVDERVVARVATGAAWADGPGRYGFSALLPFRPGSRHRLHLRAPDGTVLPGTASVERRAA